MKTIRNMSLALAVMLIAPALMADTKVFVQNNTSLTFALKTSRSGHYLSSSKWGGSSGTVKPGDRKRVVWFNRDSGIKSGKYFYFNETLTTGSASLVLKQRLKGRWIGSTMWQSLSGYGIDHPWYSDRSTHVATWYVNGRAIQVKYRAFFTGGYDHIEYILQEEYLVQPGDANTLNVLAYNIYMRPAGLFKNGQSIRAGLIPGRVKGYDVIVFSEAFDNSARAKLLNGLRSEYPYQSKILGADRGVYQDGGVIIVSKWPIKAQAQRTFKDECSGSDCLSDKGVLYVKIEKQGRPYHVFGSHTQAWSTAEGREVRKVQFRIIKEFIDSRNIPSSEAVIIAGDLNVDKINFPDEYQEMLSLLRAAQPAIQGYPYTFDNGTNRLASSGPREYLDYVLYSTDHARAESSSFNETRMIRSLEEWKEYFWEYAYWDLSDHYAVYGRMEFKATASSLPAWLWPYFSWGKLF